MAIVRWAPTRDMLALRNQMERLMESAWDNGWATQSGQWQAVSAFPVDVYQTDKEYVVKATLPGVKADDLDVSIVGESLSIKAQTREETNVDEDSWLLKESRYSSFARTLTLPTEVQSDKVEATLEDGILTLKLPKSEALLPRTIKVKPGK